MRIAGASFAFLVLSATVAAQQYVIFTYAGGAPPPALSPAVSGSIGTPISVATDAAGNAYFASPDLNSVFKLDPSGLLARVAGSSAPGYSGDGGPATSARLNLWFGNSSVAWAGLAVDRAGNLFIADTGNHSIRRVSPDGIITTVAGTGRRGFSGDGAPAVSAQLNWPSGVAVDGASNLYIVDLINFRIRKVSANGIITTVAGGGNLPGSSADGEPATSALLAAWAVAADSAGNLFIADTYIKPDQVQGASIRKISPSGIITTLAQGWGWGVAVDGSGNVFVTMVGGGRIDKISADGTTTVAGNGTAGFSGDGGSATNAQLSYPAGLAVDGAGNLLIADRLNYRIRKVSPIGIIATVAGNGTGPGAWPNGAPVMDGGPATSSQLNPLAVAADGAGNLFIADSANHRIRMVSPEGMITTVAGKGTPGFSGDDGPATSAQFNWPIGVATDRAGNVFVLDAGNSRIRKVSVKGVISTVAGNGIQGYSGDDGPATTASIGSSDCNRYCGGLAVDHTDNLFLAVNDRIRKVSRTGIITTVAGGGTSWADDVVATNAQVSPVGVAVDGGGNLFIAEYGRVRRVSSSGTITTVAGGGTIPGASADGGLATNAQLSYPYGVAVDGAGNLFITDPGGEFFAPGEAGSNPADHRIRRVSPEGIITTLAGNGTRDFSGDGGPASSATLNGPAGLTVDGAGNIYVADSDNQVVRILRPINQSVLLGRVVGAASQRAEPVSPGKIAVIYGAGLGPSQLIQNHTTEGVFGTELAGTKVSFNGISAPVLYTSATQVAVVVPYAVTGTAAEVRVTYHSEASTPFTVPVAASMPSLFTLNQAGWGQAAAINADGTANSAANPVKIGGSISLYATGEGQTAPAGVDGNLGASTPAHPVLPVTVTVGGIPATIQYAGGAPGQVAGLMQVNTQIPSGVEPGGYVPVVLQVGDKSSSPAVWIAVAN